MREKKNSDLKSRLFFKENNDEEFYDDDVDDIIIDSSIDTKMLTNILKKADEASLHVMKVRETIEDLVKKVGRRT